jgi:hypothetical protein
VERDAFYAKEVRRQNGEGRRYREGMVPGREQKQRLDIAEFCVLPSAFLLAFLRLKKLTPLECKNFVDNSVKRPQYLESEMLPAQNVGTHLQYGTLCSDVREGKSSRRENRCQRRKRLPKRKSTNS